MGAQKRTVRDEAPMDPIVTMLMGAGLSAATGLMAKAFGLWKDTGVSKAEMELRLAQMQKEWERTNRELEKTAGTADGKFASTIAQHQALLLMVTELQAKQNVTNQVLIDGMKSINAKMEGHDTRFGNIEHQTREFQTTQSMIRELLEEVRARK